MTRKGADLVEAQTPARLQITTYCMHGKLQKSVWRTREKAEEGHHKVIMVIEEAITNSAGAQLNLVCLCFVLLKQVFCYIDDSAFFSL